MNESYNDNVPLIRVINDNDSFNGSLNETQDSIALSSFSKKKKIMIQLLKKTKEEQYL
jgi:phospholipid-translocating ATPase